MLRSSPIGTPYPPARLGSSESKKQGRDGTAGCISETNATLSPPQLHCSPTSLGLALV